MVPIIGNNIAEYIGKNVSPHISWYEATLYWAAKRLGVDNTPTIEKYKAMVQVAYNIYEPIRENVCGNKPLEVAAFYRGPTLNALTPGASLASQHMFGEAVDVDCDRYLNGTNKEIFDYVRQHMEFDQMIWEFGDAKNPGWVHISYVVTRENRKKLTRAYKDNEGKPRYINFDLY